MNIMAFFFALGFSFISQAATTTKLTPFQNNIQTCLQDRINVKKVKNLNDLYEALIKKYALRSTEMLFREVQFTKNNELLKLKFEKGKILLFKIDDDKTLKLVNNDARQKGLTEESSINQLLVGADVQFDSLQIKEIRSEQTLLQYSRQQNTLTALTFEIPSKKTKLECSHIDLSDICLCRQ